MAEKPGSIEATVSILDDLIAFPTISSDSNLELINHAAGLLETVGAKVRVYQDESGQKANLFATLGPETDGGIVLSGHSDVVPVEGQDWSTDPFRMTERDGKLFGRGTADMKGFIAATLAMAPVWSTVELTRPVHFCFTHDEEVGCLGARALMGELEKLPFRPSVCVIGEPTDMRIIEGHKGGCEYLVKFKGLAGHASLPDEGVNAVEFAVRYVGRLMELREDLKRRADPASRFNPPWTTLQVGRLSGGIATNVIPDQAEIDWEMRPVQNSDRDYVKEEIASFVSTVLLPEMKAVSPDADIVTDIIGEVDGLMPEDDNAALELVRELTGGNSADVVSFGTEAGLFQGIGISTVVCGPGSIEQAHKPDEFVSVDQLSQALDMLGNLTRRLA